MELKLFGKRIFEFNKHGSGALWIDNENSHNKNSKILPDFYSMTEGGSSWGSSADATQVLEVTSSAALRKLKGKKGLTGKMVMKPVELSPKDIYELKTLNSKGFQINVNKEYIDEQLEVFKDKLSLIKSSEHDMRRGVVEIASILIRLENRKKYAKYSSFFENYPYTTQTNVDKLLKDHSHLQLGTVDQFVADMPKEAINEMKAYEKQTKWLCDKKPIFYIIAKKKDFQKSEKRRDPILLAQSPFCHNWQIIGAWDEEMMFLEEL